MNKRWIALVLALVLVLSAGMVSALAGENTQTPAENAAAAALAAETADQPAAHTAAAGSEPETVLTLEEAAPDAILFADLEALVKKNSPAYRALMSNASAIDDAADQYSQLQEQLAQVEKLLEKIERDPSLEGSEAVGGKTKAQLQKTKTQLQSGISALSSMASQDSGQMEASARQVILGCETIYISLVDLEIQETALERQLAALDRTLSALRVRADGGQVSQLQLQEAESGRTALASGLATLRMNMTNLRMQLESMLGKEISGKAAVGVLPKVTDEQLAALDLEKDLKQVLRRGADIQAAMSQRDAVDMAGLSGDLEDSMSAAADYGIQSAKLQAEVQFRSLYAQLQDQRQVIAAARSALETEQLSYDAAALKYERGSISHHELLAAADDLQTAKETVATAENKLFATYNQYQWAVQYGIFA